MCFPAPGKIIILVVAFQERDVATTFSGSGE